MCIAVLQVFSVPLRRRETAELRKEGLFGIKQSLAKSQPAEQQQHPLHRPLMQQQIGRRHFGAAATVGRLGTERMGGVSHGQGGIAQEGPELPGQRLRGEFTVGGGIRQ